jgi:predicted enzyme related to lactoylglutathione lyase
MLSACQSSPIEDKQTKNTLPNPVSYFEIPMNNMERAMRFYEAVFDLTLEQQRIDGHPMALFPYSQSRPGITGALAQGDSYQPSKHGPRIYFTVDSIESTLRRAITNGGKLAYPKTRVDTFWVAEFIDSEGNQIALTSPID